MGEPRTAPRSWSRSAGRRCPAGPSPSPSPRRLIAAAGRRSTKELILLEAGRDRDRAAGCALCGARHCPADRGDGAGGAEAERGRTLDRHSAGVGRGGCGRARDGRGAAVPGGAAGGAGGAERVAGHPGGGAHRRTRARQRGAGGAAPAAGRHPQPHAGRRGGAPCRRPAALHQPGGAPAAAPAAAGAGSSCTDWPVLHRGTARS